MVDANKAVTGHTKSCGCLSKASRAIRTKTHGESRTRLYKLWVGIKVRCYNENSTSYKRYGANGISMCDDWKNSFESFKSWANEHGYADDLTIDRISSAGNYSPENCRWADYKTQNRNKRNIKLAPNDIPVIRVMYNEGMTLKAIGKLFEVPLQSISYIINGKQWAGC